MMTSQDLVIIKLTRLPKVCPICRGELSYSDKLVICPGCSALYHAKCVSNLIGDVMCLHCGKISVKNFLKW